MDIILFIIIFSVAIVYRIIRLMRQVSNVDLEDPAFIFFIIGAILLFIFVPFVAIFIVPITFIIYRVVRTAQLVNDSGSKRRKDALLKVQPYLQPYKDIWKNLTISNKYCTLKLGSDGKLIIGIEKQPGKYLPYRKFRITESQVFPPQELWNLFCINFSYNKSYEGLLEDCRLFRASVYEDIITPKQEKIAPKSMPVNQEKIDINNCSEAELTALPCISIVIAKKIIKKREEIGGFKSLGEFFEFIKLKQNSVKQLESRIVVNKMKGNLQITRSKERNIDL